MSQQDKDAEPFGNAFDITWLTVVCIKLKELSKARSRRRVFTHRRTRERLILRRCVFKLPKQNGGRLLPPFVDLSEGLLAALLAALLASALLAAPLLATTLLTSLAAALLASALLAATLLASFAALLAATLLTTALLTSALLATVLLDRPLIRIILVFHVSLSFSDVVCLRSLSLRLSL